MPRLQSAPSLSEICYTSIVTNIDSFWYKAYENSRYYEGADDRPFDYLPSVMVEPIISQLGKKRLLRTRHLRLLLNKRTSVLNLHFPEERLDMLFADPIDVRLNQRLLPDLITQCQNLTELCLPAFRDLTPKHLETMMRSLPRLLRLNLTDTSSTDKVLAAIGATCGDLQELYISYCLRVSDVGLRELCGQSVGAKPKCPSLRILNIMSTKVSCFGFRLALENLKELETLEASCSLRQWDDARVESVDDSTYPLRTLRLQSPSFRNNTPNDETVILRKILSKCPQIESLLLRNRQLLPVTRELVVYLSSLESLKEFEAHHDGSDYQLFQYGYQPFLRAQGVKLQALKLEVVSGVDLELIGQCCTLLSDLHITTSISSEGFKDLSKEAEQLLKDFSYFPSLTSVSLTMEKGANFTVSHGKILLSCCHNLSTLFFDSVQAFTDELIQEVRMRNKLANLKDCYFCQCHNFRPESLDFLIKDDSVLEELGINECYQVKRRDYKSWKKYVKKHNLKLDIEWTEGI